jgi:hypothetical protein
LTAKSGINQALVLREEEREKANVNHLLLLQIQINMLGERRGFQGFNT